MGRTGGNNVNATVGGQATIVDNDSNLPSIRIDDVVLDESGGNAVFTVSLSRASVLHTVTVNYATGNDTATAGTDFTNTTGTLTFAPGVTSMTISVPITNDAGVDAAALETFFVNLTNAANAVIADGRASAPSPTTTPPARRRSSSATPRPPKATTSSTP
ncbi:hypothetical protein HK414_03070 [Ramlibacter terrae]|uniref:Calx-beta domain-containing protein n=1 Tax=Ramlibacter terrae TaxID=2732511 RepID=A0ABX6P0D3_9BURK|nr:hypothetical protein HK414_03070 [Ramlibacter terrae]